MVVLTSFLLLFIAYSEATSIETCSKDSDCSTTKSCLQGICMNPCNTGICSTDGPCIVLRHKAHCFCKNFSDNCLKKKFTKPCIPECGENSFCNTSIGYCECNDGFQGNPYRKCLKKCETYNDCSFGEVCVRKICKNQCEENCGVNSNCILTNHSNICTCPLGFTGNPLEICRPIVNIRSSTKKCEECGENAECKLDEDDETCSCPRGYIGNPYKSCKKICLKDTDCPVEQICVFNTCRDPCKDACGVNALCTLEKFNQKQKCQCMEGFTGDPTRICTLILENRFLDTTIECNPKCGKNATCDNKYGVCHCNEGFIGNPYGECRKKCTSNSDCFENEACFNGDCKDLCLSCGKHKKCLTTNHEVVCECPPGSSWDLLGFCKKKIGQYEALNHIFPSLQMNRSQLRFCDKNKNSNLMIREMLE